MKLKPSTLYTIILTLIIGGVITWIFVTQIEEYTLQSDPKLKVLKEKISPLFSSDKNYTGILSSLNNRKNILNEISLYRGEKSYTINKHKIYLCLRDENGDYYNDMMLLHVLIHEICHCLCDEIGHTEKFNDMLDALLDEAHIMGVYDKNYELIQNYCTYNDK
jgi:hypothetical protein